jgi:hypothetical protein
LWAATIVPGSADGPAAAGPVCKTFAKKSGPDIAAAKRRSLKADDIVESLVAPRREAIYAAAAPCVLDGSEQRSGEKRTDLRI